MYYLWRAKRYKVYSGKHSFWHYSSTRHPLRFIKHFLAKIHLQFFSMLTDKFVCSAWSSLLAWYWFCFKSIWKMPWMGCYGLPFFYLCNWSSSIFGNGGGGSGRGFLWAMKYFSKFLMVHKIFSYVLFLLLFFFFFWVKGDGAQNIQLAIKEI